MLKAILMAIGFLGQLLAWILGKRAKLKSAEERLPEESPTAQVVMEAESKAEEKFGPRLSGRGHQPVQRVTEGVTREVESTSPKS